MSEDYYNVLNVSRNASQSEIQTAYREQARKHHPDMNPDDESAKQRFQQVQRAFEVLGDPKKRELYDRYGSSFESMGQGGPQGGGPWQTTGAGPGGMDDIDFSQFFGEKFGAGGPGPAGGGGGGWADIFNQFRGGAGGGRRGARPRQAPKRGADIEHTLGIPFTTSITGGAAELSVSRHGGKVETISVKIPAGIEDGKKIRLRQQGDASPGGGKRGDILIKIHVASHPCYSRSGRNLNVKVPVTLAEAALGAKVDLPTPTGIVTLTVPPGTSSGAKLRLKGRGVAAVKGPPGDLLAEIQIVIPKTLDEESRKLVEQLAAAGPESPRAELKW